MSLLIDFTKEEYIFCPFIIYILITGFVFYSVTFFSFARQRVANHYLENCEEIEAPEQHTGGLSLIRTGVVLLFWYLK